MILLTLLLETTEVLPNLFMLGDAGSSLEFCQVGLADREGSATSGDKLCLRADRVNLLTLIIWAHAVHFNYPPLTYESLAKNVS